MDFSFYVQLLLNGIVMGVIYALVAMGLSLIFGVLEIVNFAHGEFYMMGAMAAYFATVRLGLGYWSTVIAVTLGAPQRERQHGVQSIQRLDGGFLVETEDDRVLGRCVGRGVASGASKTCIDTGTSAPGGERGRAPDDRRRL